MDTDMSIRWPPPYYSLDFHVPFPRNYTFVFYCMAFRMLYYTWKVLQHTSRSVIMCQTFRKYIEKYSLINCEMLVVPRDLL